MHSASARLHARIDEQADGVRDAILELVLDGRDAHQLQVALNALRHLQHTRLAFLYGTGALQGVR